MQNEYKCEKIRAKLKNNLSILDKGYICREFDHFGMILCTFFKHNKEAKMKNNRSNDKETLQYSNDAKVQPLPTTKENQKLQKSAWLPRKPKTNYYL